jgi:hypothetical protein
MAWIFARRRASAGLKPIWRAKDIFTWALAGLWFGIVTRLQWRRGFRWPLVFVTVPNSHGCIAGGLVPAQGRSFDSTTTEFLAVVPRPLAFSNCRVSPLHSLSRL